MHTSIHSEPSETTRHSRTQWFTAYTVLSPVNGCFATVASGIASARLDTSTAMSGPHAFAVRFRAVRYRRIRVHRIPPRERYDRVSPLCWDGTVVNIKVICTS